MPEDAQHQYYKGRKVAANTKGSHVSATKTATGTGAAFATVDTEAVKGTLVVTAASGTTPTLDLTLETTADGTNWYTAPGGTFPQQTTTTTGVSRIAGPVGDSCRWKWTVGGTTPSFTFKIDGLLDEDT